MSSIEVSQLPIQYHYWTQPVSQVLNGWKEPFLSEITKNLETIRAIEKLGGSEGYIKFLSKPFSEAEPRGKARGFTQNTILNVNVTESFAHLAAILTTADGHTTSYATYNLPFLQNIKFAGVVEFDSWETIMSARNYFSYTVGEEAVLLSIGDQTVGQIVIQELSGIPTGTPGVTFGGWLTWTT